MLCNLCVYFKRFGSGKRTYIKCVKHQKFARDNCLFYKPRKTITLRFLGQSVYFKKLNKPEEFEYYHTEFENIKNSIFEDILKNPRKYLDEAENETVNTAKNNK